MAKTKEVSEKAIEAIRNGSLEEAAKNMAIALVETFEEQSYQSSTMKDLISLMVLLRGFQQDSQTGAGENAVDDWILTVEKRNK
jgi:SOS response regulatory protein OraA/RecX